MSQEENLPSSDTVWMSSIEIAGEKTDPIESMMWIRRTKRTYLSEQKHQGSERAVEERQEIVGAVNRGIKTHYKEM